MKRKFIIISSLLLFIIACNAQTDSAKFKIDSVKTQPNIVITSVSTTQQVDSTTITSANDSTKYALLYVYRPRNFVGSIMSYKLKVSNGTYKEMVVGSVKNNMKFVVKLYQEGPTEIYAQTEAKTVVKLNVKFGSSYYLKCGISMGAFVGRPALDLIYPAQGELDYGNM